MATRNFYINCQIDGRSTMLSGGPRRKDGGFDMSIMMRDDGTRRGVVLISGTADTEGNLTLRISPDNGQEDIVVKTTR